MADRPDEMTSHLRIVTDVLDAASRVRPHQLVDLVIGASSALGATSTRVWLSDHGQRNLVHLTSDGRPRPSIPIDGSAAGRAWVTGVEQERERSEVGDHFWLPLVEGVDRIGVLEVEHPALTPSLRVAYGQLASVTAVETVTRGRHTDLFHMLRRQRPMSLAAELQWQALPPSSFSAPEVSVSAMLEPAYQAAGDAFDHVYADQQLDFAILDSVGHDLGSTMISTLALGAYRNRRRAGAGLVATGRAIDQVIVEQVGDAAFVTGIMARLDTCSGRLSWLNAGHPPPLLVRHGRDVCELSSTRRVPLGLGHLLPNRRSRTASVQLEPGDGVLLYSDGIVEARTGDGEDFGLDRLKEFLAHAFAAELSPAETVRRLSNAVLDHHGGRLDDDASTLLMIWHPDGPPA